MLLWRKHTKRNGGKGAERKKKVFAVRYADETVMTSMPEWTQSVPGEYTHTMKNTHEWHTKVHKPTLAIENTAT